MARRPPRKTPRRPIRRPSRDKVRFPSVPIPERDDRIDKRDEGQRGVRDAQFLHQRRRENKRCRTFVWHSTLNSIPRETSGTLRDDPSNTEFRSSNYGLGCRGASPSGNAGGLELGLD